MNWHCPTIHFFMWRSSQSFLYLHVSELRCWNPLVEVRQNYYLPAMCGSYTANDVNFIDLAARHQRSIYPIYVLSSLPAMQSWSRIHPCYCPFSKVLGKLVHLLTSSSSFPPTVLQGVKKRRDEVRSLYITLRHTYMHTYYLNTSYGMITRPC